MTLCWLVPLLFMDCTQGTTALAQASALSTDHLMGHEAGGRMPRHGQTVMAAAEVGEQGEVGVRLRQLQDPGSITTTAAREIVYGSVAFLAFAPSSFISDIATKNATQTAVNRTAVQPGPQARLLSVRTATVTTALLPDVQMGVKVDFTLAFRNTTDQEAFTQQVAADGGAYMVRNISGSVPDPNRGRCQQQLSLISSGSDVTSSLEQGQVVNKYDTIRFELADGQSFETIRERLEKVSGAIASAGKADRVKVGLLMVPDPPAYAILNYWITAEDPTKGVMGNSRAAIQSAIKTVLSNQLR